MHVRPTAVDQENKTSFIRGWINSLPRRVFPRQAIRCVQVQGWDFFFYINVTKRRGGKFFKLLDIFLAIGPKIHTTYRNYGRRPPPIKHRPIVRGRVKKNTVRWWRYVPAKVDNIIMQLRWVLYHIITCWNGLKSLKLNFMDTHALYEKVN